MHPQPLTPTAQALFADVAATFLSAAPPFLPPAGVGLGTCFQALPFQWRIRESPLPHPQSPVVPTAQAVAETAPTPIRVPPVELTGLVTSPGVGLETRF